MNTLSAKTIEEITKFIFVSNEPVMADAIFVVGGSLPQAAELAAELYKKGYSDKIFIGGKYSIKHNCFPKPEYHTEYDFYKDILMKNGVCEAFHAKRSLLFYQMYFPDVEFSVVTFDGFDISKDNWYKSEYGIKRVLGEMERIGSQISPELIKDFNF